MALQFNSLTFLNFSSDLLPRQARVRRVHHGAIRTSGYVCQAAMQTDEGPIIERRSGHWKPSIWEDDFLKTLKNDHKEEVYQSRAELLKAKVRHELLDRMQDDKGTLALLELIDDVQRLGLGYIFEQDIRKALGFLKEKNVNLEGNLHATSLCFRLLRQHGFDVSQDVFKVFKGLRGNFMDHLSKDIKGILSL
ncbi:Isoprene synthase protein [Thalictrum thalictroides]|uniref:Isoprene synthase protein n=1 Tax=Thalictrum thalictroides TaxID=46969 RepID=A0A7J6XBU9_THATH|nr:Isoprene synthase protein [Thalictrum thalictroides]